MLALVGKIASIGGCGVFAILLVLYLVGASFARRHRRERRATYLDHLGRTSDEFLGKKPAVSTLYREFDQEFASQRDAAARDRRGQYGLPRLNTPEDLRQFLALARFAQLVHLADASYRQVRRVQDENQRQRLSNYWRRTIPKRGGGVRRLCAPKPRLKEAQRRILRGILERVPVHPAATAFRKGRGIEDHARAHVGRQVVVALDLEDFFPTIRRARVSAFFRWLGYPPSVASLLALLCTTDDGGGHQPRRSTPQGHLLSVGEAQTRRVVPQGAPTSPAIANLVCFRLDCRLSGLAKKFGATYTRYADDLAFSGDEEFKRGLSRFLPLLRKIVSSEGFRPHPNKWRVMRHGTRQHLTGLTINTKPGVGRDEIDALKALLHRATKAGSLESQNKDALDHFADHIAGRVAWVARFHPGKSAKMQAQMAALLGRENKSAAHPAPPPAPPPIRPDVLPDAPPPE